ncbi:MAG: glycosyltransferase [Syntrophorhabdaceae bacterium]
MPKKILYLHPSVHAGGPHLSLYALIANMDRNRFQPTVFLPSDSSLEEAFRKLSVDVFYHHAVVTVPRSFSPVTQTKYLASLYQSARYLSNFIKTNDIDLVHTNMEACWVGGLAATFAKRPAISHLRCLSTLHPSPVGYLTAFMLNRFSTTIISTSDEVKRQYEKAGVHPEKIITIYNGLNANVFNPGKTSPTLRGELNLRDDQPLIGLIANFDYRKGHHDFVKACAIIHKRHPDAKFVIAGSTSLTDNFEYYQSIREMVDHEGLSGNMVFLGARSDIPQILKSLDVVVQSSLTEAGPRVPLEAMAMECPLVVTDAGGSSEEVINEQTGFVVPIGDVGAIAATTMRLLSDPALCAKIGNAGRKRVLRIFTDEVYAQKVQQVYQQILEHPH